MQGALRNVRIGKLAAACAAVVALSSIAALGLTGQPLLSWRTSLLLVAAAAGAAGAMALRGLEARFTYRDYVHAEHD